MTREPKFDVDKRSTFEEPHPALWLERGAAAGRLLRAFADTASSVGAVCRKVSASASRAGGRFFRRAVPTGNFEDRHA